MNETPTDPRALITLDSVKKAFEAYNDIPRLGRSDLARLDIVSVRLQNTGGFDNENGRGLALQDILGEALEEIRPTESQENLLDERWQFYLVIKQRYIKEKSIGDVQKFLESARNTVITRTSEALNRIVGILYKWEQNLHIHQLNQETKEQHIKSSSQNVSVPENAETNAYNISEEGTQEATSEEHTVGNKRESQKITYDQRIIILILAIILTVVVGVTANLKFNRNVTATEPSVSTGEFAFASPSTIHCSSTGVNPTEFIINLNIKSKKCYEWQIFTKGLKMYIDRPTDRGTYTFRDVPFDLLNQYILIPANDDKENSAKDVDFISFTVNQDVEVYVLYTSVETTLEETWLSKSKNWSEKTFTVSTTLLDEERIRKAKSKFYKSGSKVELGGNGGTSNDTSMYHVVVVPSNPQ